jgi:chromatin-remodeling ATPase INO80
MSKTAAAATRDLWTEEGDEFFGHSGPVQPGLQESGKDIEDGTVAPKPARSNKRSRPGATTGSRGRKATAKGGSRRKPALESGDVSSAL